VAWVYLIRPKCHKCGACIRYGVIHHDEYVLIFSQEVGGYYQAGMKIPDDVTILWSDDNSGNVQRLPIPSEANRVGGAGVYYHFDYVGDPRNYKWINTIQLSKTWQQMYLTYHKKASQIWIVNVGDLKPLVGYTHMYSKLTIQLTVD
jgi:hypothetical protein